MVLLSVSGFGMKTLVRLRLDCGDTLRLFSPVGVVLELRCPRTCYGVVCRSTCVIF